MLKKTSYFLGVMIITPLLLVIIQQLSLKIIQVAPKLVLLLFITIVPGMIQHFLPHVYYNGNIPQQTK